MNHTVTDQSLSAQQAVHPVDRRAVYDRDLDALPSVVLHHSPASIPASSSSSSSLSLSLPVLTAIFQENLG